MYKKWTNIRSERHQPTTTTECTGFWHGTDTSIQNLAGLTWVYLYTRFLQILKYDQQYQIILSIDSLMVTQWGLIWIAKGQEDWYILSSINWSRLFS